MGGKLGGGEFNDINMTPLIDIVLVVLIIMMVNIPIEVQEMGVRVPHPDPPPPPPTPPDAQQLMVALYENGDIALNRMIITEEQLKGQLQIRLPGLAKKNVFVDAHPSVPLKKVVDMLDMAKESGAEKVGFAKLKDDGPLAAVGVETGAMPRGIILGNPVVVELLDTKSLDNVTADQRFQAILPTITACYYAALGTNPKLTGDYMLEVTVGPDGQQMAEKHPPKFLKDSLEEPTVRACTEEVLPQLAYPSIGEQNTAVVRYSLLFSPG